MTKPVRIQLRRNRGYKLQDVSEALNGLPAVNVARPTRFGNPWKVSDYIEAGYAASEEQAAQVCVDAFRAWIEGEPHWAHASLPTPPPDISELRGKNLRAGANPVPRAMRTSCWI